MFGGACERLEYEVQQPPGPLIQRCVSEHRASERRSQGCCRLPRPEFKQGSSGLNGDIGIWDQGQAWPRAEEVLGSGGPWWLRVGQLLPSALPLTWHTLGRRRAWLIPKLGEMRPRKLPVTENRCAGNFAGLMSFHLPESLRRRLLSAPVCVHSHVYWWLLRDRGCSKCWRCSRGQSRQIFLPFKAHVPVGTRPRAPALAIKCVAC